MIAIISFFIILVSSLLVPVIYRRVTINTGPNGFIRCLIQSSPTTLDWDAKVSLSGPYRGAGIGHHYPPVQPDGYLLKAAHLSGEGSNLNRAVNQLSNYWPGHESSSISDQKA
jgi:hypothetical protein